MKIVLKIRRFAGSAGAMLLLAAMIAAHQIPAHAGDQAGSGLPAPITAVSAPSFERVMELVEEQGKEIEALRAALRDQQQLTARILEKLNSSGAAVSELPTSEAAGIPGEGPAAGLAEKVAGLETEMGQSQKEIESRLKKLGPFAFSGDLRLRAEPTFGGPVDRSQDRFRGRMRLRVNAEARLNDQFEGGFSLASGDLNDPISTNQSLNQYDARKPIAIDRAYATYKPSWLHSLTLTDGKFSYPWFNTELVWDRDLNPEGAGETLAFRVRTPILKKIAIVGFQLPFAENKRNFATDKSLYNTIVYGEQLQT
ncbi:MAG: putative porin, partial [Candidatus Acidiferrales bacterium]